MNRGAAVLLVVLAACRNAPPPAVPEEPEPPPEPMFGEGYEGNDRDPPPRLPRSGPVTPETRTCALNLASIPQAKVMIDDTPVGLTPRTNVAVLANTEHIVTFVSLDGGTKRAVAIRCRPGETKTAATKLVP